MKRTGPSKLSMGVAGLALCVALCFLSGCFNQDRLASSEVGNPAKKGMVVGTALDSTGQAVVGALIRLRPKDYLQTQTSLAGLPVEWETHSDSAGKFSLSKVDTGLYRVEVGLGATGAIQDCRMDTPGQRLDLVRAYLLPLGHLEGNVKVPGGSPPPFAQIPGMERRVQVNSETGHFVFADLPGGAYRVHFTSARADVLPATVENITVQSGRNTSLPENTLEENLAVWAHSQSLLLNTPALTASGDSGISTDLPVLVRLPVGSFAFSQAMRDGADLRFTQPSGQPLEYEIDFWDSTAGTAQIWVKVKSPPVGESQTSIQMYWGNRFAPGISSAPRVFVAAAQYAGVWHLGENPAGPAPQFLDASMLGNLATLRGTPSLSVSTPWGRGLELDGSQYLTTRNAFDNPRYLTHSLWMQTTSKQGGWILGFSSASTDTSHDYDRHIWMDDSGCLHLGVYQNYKPPLPPSDTVYSVLSTSGKYNDGQWHLLTSVIAPDGQSIFVDGKLVAKDSIPRPPAAFKGYWRIGFEKLRYWKPAPSQDYFHGRIDEVRVWQTALSPNRIQWEYESQKPDFKWPTSPGK